MDGLGMLPLFPYPWVWPPFFQVGALGELLVAYVTVIGGNEVVRPLAPAWQWHFIPVAAPEFQVRGTGQKQATDWMMNVVPPAGAALVVVPAVMSGGALPPQWIGGTGVFLPTPRCVLSTSCRTPNFPPKKAVRHAPATKELELMKAPAVKEMVVKLDTEAGLSKVTTRQDHVKEAAATEKHPKPRQRKDPPALAGAQPELQQKGKNNGVKEQVEEAPVEDFPELLLLPEEWTY